MADNEGMKTVLTVKSIKGTPWAKPDSDQLWYNIVAEEKPGEPITFIQDTAKDAPAPEYGKKYSGKVYPNPKGLRFYADGAKYQNVGGEAPSASQSATAAPQGSTSGTTDWDDRQKTISAQWAIGQANQIAIACGSPEAMDAKFIEEGARDLLAMVDRLKGQPAVEVEPTEGLDVFTEEELAEAKDARPSLSDIPF